MSLAAGVRLGAYEIISQLGAGGMGEVYLAHDPRLRREVAIKVLPPAFAEDASRLRRFEREARAVAALSHPNILAIYDIGRHENTPYIVMEYVRGETLGGYLQRERPSCARALEIGAEIADALAVAHDRRIVHRDLKPSNVMMTPDGHVKVLDFGLAKAVAAEAVATGDNTFDGSTGPGQPVGTPGYMSPEQMLGDPIDHRTDVYSLGVMLFELTTGKRPFQSRNWDALWRAMLTEPVPAACDTDPSVPAAVSNMIARAMAKDPSARPQSATVLRAELKQLISTAELQPVVTTLSPSDERRTFHRIWGRRRVRYAAWALAAALSITAVAVPAWRSFSTKNVSPVVRPVIAVLPLTNLTGDASKDYLGVGIADTLTTSLGRLSSVSVVSRSTMQESGEAKTTNLVRIARDLGATMLVRGSFQQSGDRLRVTANLITADGRIEWSGDSEAGFADLFLLESRLASALVDALRVTISDAERKRLVSPPTPLLEALEAYWQGTALLDRTDNTGIDRAIADFQRAIRLDGDFSLAHAALGEAYRRKSLTTNDALLMKSAVDEVSRALQLDPAQPEVRLSLASVYRYTGRNGAAVEQLRQVLADQPLNDDAHRQLGDLLASEGRPDEALNELQRAVALRPQYWRNQQLLGLFYLRAGKLDEAVATLTRLTELRPDDITPYQQLGAAYQMLGDNVHARQNYERAIRVSPNPASYANLGTIHYSEGRYDAAAEAYEQAIRLAPARAPVYHRNLGDAYLKLDRTADARVAYEKAAELAEEALTVNPSSATTLSELSVYQAKLGKRREAERNSNAAVVINPSSPQVLYESAVVLALNGNPDGAVQRLSEAISRGYPRRLALEDDDMATLRSLPAFQSLTASSK